MVYSHYFLKQVYHAKKYIAPALSSFPYGLVDPQGQAKVKIRSVIS